MTFAEFVEQFKSSRELSYDKIATRLTLRGYHVTKQAVNSWVKNHAIPDIANPVNRRAICDVFGLDESRLLEFMGYTVKPESLSDEARYGAHLINKMTPEKRQLAVDLLERLAE